jgi:hypothetical protein
VRIVRRIEEHLQAREAPVQDGEEPLAPPVEDQRLEELHDPARVEPFDAGDARWNELAGGDDPRGVAPHTSEIRA